MEAIVAVVLWGLVVGALARLAVPGPDPMPWWLTLAFGVGGSLVALLVVGSMMGEPTTGEQASEVALAIFVASVIMTSLAIIVYRRVVQNRGITGPEAHRMPERGIGVDPSRAGSDGASADAPARLRRLAELRDEGLITEDEFLERRRAILDRL